MQCECQCCSMCRQSNRRRPAHIRASLAIASPPPFPTAASQPRAASTESRWFQLGSGGYDSQAAALGSSPAGLPCFRATASHSVAHAIGVSLLCIPGDARGCWVDQ